MWWGIFFLTVMERPCAKARKWKLIYPFDLDKQKAWSSGKLVWFSKTAGPSSKYHRLIRPFKLLLNSSDGDCLCWSPAQLCVRSLHLFILSWWSASFNPERNFCPTRPQTRTDIHRRSFEAVLTALPVDYLLVMWTAWWIREDLYLVLNVKCVNLFFPSETDVLWLELPDRPAATVLAQCDSCLCAALCPFQIYK